MDTSYLREAEAYWTRTANLWDQVFTAVHDLISTPGVSFATRMGPPVGQQLGTTCLAHWR
ncbi:hypothetical protein I553_2829 [Mycobacterium xenopi 4042]|uniref:Uncharacterized protein n=1 Tax=Mycobacterium xenopi 4042 TaxID=1299334 RepID=X8EFB8_MYCXE|nr:hypothetical protein I553_2829 [Mycobacterium xenopi 4042]